MRQYQDGHSLFIGTQTNINHKETDIFIYKMCEAVIIKIKIGDDLSTI